MNLYTKVLGLLKPFIKRLIWIYLLTGVYVFFNMLSLWVSVDFLGELFKTEAQVETTVLETLESSHDQLDLYNKIKLGIKSIIIQPDRFETLKLVCIIIFLSFLFKNIAHYIRRVNVVIVELQLINNIRNKLQQTIIRLPVAYFQARHSGQLTSVVFNDVNSIKLMLNSSFDKLILIPIQVISTLIILIIMSWQLSLVTLLIAPISGFLIHVIGQSVRRKSRRVLEKISSVMTVFQEAVSNIWIVKAFTAEEKEENRFKKANSKYFTHSLRQHKLKFLTSPLNETIGVMILVVLLWYGAHLVYRQQTLTAEDFMRYLIFLFTIFEPMRYLTRINNDIQAGLAGAERIFKLIDEPREKYETSGSQTFKYFDQCIEYNNISFKYPEAENRALDSVNIKIAKGSTTAFVGPSGSGKTTLVSLLPGFYLPESGQILIDGTDIQNYNLQSLRSKIGLVTQEAILFNDTVKANISYGLENISDEQIISAAQSANAWPFIKKMDNGLDTIIGERGVKLSGGEKQRLSIARAILKNPPVLILDEATSSLDTVSERLVQEAIDTLMKNRTVLVIAHRLSTVIHADQIAVLDRGKIIDTGSHEKLLKTCNLYKNLYQIQFQNHERGENDRQN